MFSEKLYQLRKNEGLSQKELGDKIGVDSSCIAFLEEGEKLPSLETIIRIADFFHVTIDYLVDQTDIPNVYETHISHITDVLRKKVEYKPLSPTIKKHKENKERKESKLSPEICNELWKIYDMFNTKKEDD